MDREECRWLFVLLMVLVPTRVYQGALESYFAANISQWWMQVADLVARTLWVYNSTSETPQRYCCAQEKRKPMLISPVPDDAQVVQASVDYHHS